MQNAQDHQTRPEQLYSVQEAAELLGLKTFKLRRAVKSGLVPSYTLLNSRRLVRLTEVIEVINASRQGRGND